MKKGICLLLAALMLFAMASCAKTDGSMGLAYVLHTDEKTCTVQGRGSNTDADLVIPTTIKGDAVIAVGARAFEYDKSLKSVIIPEGVTRIGNFAFYLCVDMGTIVIPKSVTKIERYAFMSSGVGIVYYEGTAEEWDKIEIDLYNEILTGAIRAYYSEEAPTGEGKFWHYVDGKPTLWQ